VIALEAADVKEVILIVSKHERMLRGKRLKAQLPTVSKVKEIVSKGEVIMTELVECLVHPQGSEGRSTGL
jgi:hypothetical protein